LVTEAKLGWVFVLASQTALPALPPPPPPPAGAEVAPPNTIPADPTVEVPPRSSPIADEGTPVAAPVLHAAEQTPKPQPTRSWYGWQTLTLDAIAVGSVPLVYAAGVRDKQTLLAVYVPAAVLFDLGAPTVHWLQRGPRIALASFGLRVGIPLVALLIAPRFGNCVHGDADSQQKCRNRAMGIGAAVGFAVAPAVDASWLAWKPAPRAVAVTLRPSIVLNAPSRMASVGVAGSF
jgi:hypothetical protein